MKPWLQNLMKRFGYYCPRCDRYAKTFNPPFGNRVCLECQLASVDGHKAMITDLNFRNRMGILDDKEALERVEFMRKKYLSSREERE